jgi:ASC-1-like (ASCH) protein
MRFKIGEKVLFLRESGEGVVQSYKSDNQVNVLDETGFENVFPENELVEIKGDQSGVIDSTLGVKNESINAGTADHQEDVGAIYKHKEYWEIDLHTHAILDSEKGMSNHQLLSHQLWEFKRFYSKAREKRLRKIVIIHGVGEGVLKSEVRHFLEGKEGIKYYDGDFRKYGKGATTAELYYR